MSMEEEKPFRAAPVESGENAFEKDMTILEDIMKESKEKSEYEAMKEELKAKVDLVRLEDRLSKLEELYAKSKADAEILKTKLLRGKAQGKGTIPEDSEDKNRDMKRIYPELAHFFK